MTTINLYQEQGESKSSNSSNQIVDKGFLLSIGILAITLLVFGGMKFFAFDLERKSAKTDEQIKAAQASFSGDRVNSTVDFQQRLEAIKENNNSRTDSVSALSDTAKVILPSVRIVDYAQEKNALSITLSADKFLDVARQVLSFKDSDAFSGVAVSKIQRKDKIIEFLIEASVLSDSSSDKSTSEIK